MGEGGGHLSLFKKKVKLNCHYTILGLLLCCELMTRLVDNNSNPPRNLSNTNFLLTYKAHKKCLRVKVNKAINNK